MSTTGYVLIALSLLLNLITLWRSETARREVQAIRAKQR